MRRQQIKRETDLQIISEWIGEGQHVLDIGCGRGILLEHLMRNNQVRALGVDTDFDKVSSCIKRGVPVYHGDAAAFLQLFPDRFFDWIILSRTIQELSEPGRFILESLRVASQVAVGFVNQGFWLNRWHTLCSGSRPKNEVFPTNWEDGSPYNPVTIAGFTRFCQENHINITNSVFLKGDWKQETLTFPNLTAGYAIFHLANSADSGGK